VPWAIGVIARACHDLAQLQRRSMPPIHIAREVSFRQSPGQPTAAETKTLLEKDQ